MFRSPACALFALSFACATASAQAPATPAVPGASFSLEDAVARALKKNFDLQIQGYTLANAKDQVVIQDAAFDPTLTANLTRSVNQAASNTSRLDGSQTEGQRNDNTTMRVGASTRLPQTNGTLSVTTNVSRGATNSTNALVNPNYGHGISANLNQPLLRDAGKKAATAALERAKIGVTIAGVNYKSRVLAVISDTENAYYNLVAARETLRIRRLTLESNQRFLDESQARRATGVATAAEDQHPLAGQERGDGEVIEAVPPLPRLEPEHPILADP